MARLSKDSVAVAENKGRQKFVEFMTTAQNIKRDQYSFTVEEYNKVDAISNDQIAAFEIKNRDILVGKYLDRGYMIERNKYDELMKYEEGYYVNFFKNDEVMIWNVHNITQPLNWTWRYCTETTVDGTYTKGKVLKLCADLYTQDAIVYHKNHEVRDRKFWHYEKIKEWKLSKDKEIEEQKKEQERQRYRAQAEERQKELFNIARDLMNPGRANQSKPIN